MTGVMQEIATKLYEGEDEEVAELVRKALGEGRPAGEILAEGLIAGMDRVGRDFKAGDLFVPEVLIAARAMHAGMDVLRPLLAQSGARSAGRFLVGTVKGDLHDIGKNLVSIMLEGSGFEIFDLGTDVSPEKFLEAINTHKPDIVGMSALLTTTMDNMEKIIRFLEENGARKGVKVLIGGAPISQKYADDIGADGYAPDASQAAFIARRMIGKD